MAQNTVQNSSLLYPEDITLYVAEWSTTFTTLAELSSAAWINLGALTEYSRESGITTIQPSAFNAEHKQVITKEAETVSFTLQELNSSVVNILRGGVSQQVSTDMSVVGGSSSDSLTILYNGGADSLNPYMLWEYATYSDGRSIQTYFPYVHYVSGGADSPKSQGTGEYRDMAFTAEARESTTLLYNNRVQYKIELASTAST
jgi:hypothetical protein